MMKMTKQYELELRSLPFSRGDDQVIYVESQFNPEINLFIEEHLDEIKDIFAQELLKFCYVPEACERFWERHGQGPEFQLDPQLFGPRASHLRTDEVFGEQVRMGEIEPSMICNGGGMHRGDSLAFAAYHLDLSWIRNEHMMLQQFREIAKAYSRREAIDYRKVERDSETCAMLSEMDRLARALMVKGVKTQVFDDMIASLEQPSRLEIDRHGHVQLPEFGNMQIRLTPMEKTLYHFFLAHPEGIVADALIGFRPQLLRHYEAASVFDEWELAENAIDALLAEDKRTFYVNVSRIKTKFTNMLGKRIASHYVIQKDNTGLYRITLARDLVTYQRNAWKYSE